MRFAVTLLLVLVGCDPGGTPPGRDGGPPGIDAGPAMGMSCDPATPSCPAGQYCGATGRCVPDGMCLVDADCTGAERCGAASRVCLADGACAVVGDCPTGQTCALGTGQCEIGGMCGGSEIDITRLAPNMMILLDRSGSMDGTIDGQTRWDIAKEAVETVTTRFSGEIRFGLATYSACLPGGCSAGSVVVPIGDDVAPINDFLRPLRGRGSNAGTPPDYLCDSGDPETSTGPSLMALTAEASLQDPDRQNAVLLITDGQESSCGGPDGAGGATALMSLPIPVRTFAVGFSRDTSASQLMAIATAGGTSMFYQADDATALVTALESIADEVASCDYRLDSSPADPSMLFVYFNDDPAGVSMDATDGWTFDPATDTLTFHGAACAQIRGGAVSDIDVVFGCEGPVLG